MFKRFQRTIQAPPPPSQEATKLIEKDFFSETLDKLPVTDLIGFAQERDLYRQCRFEYSSDPACVGEGLVHFTICSKEGLPKEFTVPYDRTIELADPFWEAFGSFSDVVKQGDVPAGAYELGKFARFKTDLEQLRQLQEAYKYKASRLIDGMSWHLLPETAKEKKQLLEKGFSETYVATLIKRREMDQPPPIDLAKHWADHPFLALEPRSLTSEDHKRAFLALHALYSNLAFRVEIMFPGEPRAQQERGHRVDGEWKTDVVDSRRLLSDLVKVSPVVCPIDELGAYIDSIAEKIQIALQETNDTYPRNVEHAFQEAKEAVEKLTGPLFSDKTPTSLKGGAYR